MKNTTNKTSSSKDRGIAIVFSLMMLVTIFMLAFGFLSKVTSASGTANAIQPKAQADLVILNTVLSQALQTFDVNTENGILDTDTNPNDGTITIYTAPNWNKMSWLNFTDGTQTVPMLCWGTRSSDSTGLDELLKYTKTSSGDYYIPSTADPEWNDGSDQFFGWISDDINNDGTDDKYAFMIIHSDKLDANYIGGDTATGETSGKRFGIHAREIDIALLRSGYENSIYIDWDGIKPWLDKNSITSAANVGVNHKEATESLIVGTSPVTINDDTSGHFNLNDIKTTPITNITDLKTEISWLAGTGSDQLAANILDYVDEDTEMTTDNSTYFGNERVPYINEVAFIVTNNTNPTSSGNPATPTDIDVSVMIELVDMYDTGRTWGTPNGSSTSIDIDYNITTKRGSDPVETFANQTISITPSTAINAAGAWNGAFTIDTNIVNSQNITGSSTDTTQDITVTDITVNSIQLTANTTLWDYAKLNITTDTTIGYLAKKGISVECNEPRLNELTASWDATSWAANATETLSNYGGSSSATNPSYTPDTGTNIDKELINSPDRISTAYIPLSGGIIYPFELGFIHRGVKYQTLNMRDYNMSTSATFQQADYEAAAGSTNLANTSTFDGGDRSILDYVYTGLPEYNQYGIINPNSTDEKTLELLLANTHPTYGPYALDIFNGTTNGASYDADALDPNNATTGQVNLDNILKQFPWKAVSTDPSTAAVLNQFDFDNFDSSTPTHHNPQTLGHIVNDTTLAAALTDAQKEAVVMKSSRLLSTKYSYFTILGAVEMGDTGATSSLYTFIRLDNETGEPEIIRKEIR